MWLIFGTSCTCTGLSCTAHYSIKVRINQYRLLWINPFRCSRPLFPTEATDKSHRAGTHSTREEDHVRETGSNITPPDLLRLRCQVGFSGAPRNVQHAFPAIFLPRSGKAKQRRSSRRRCIHSPARLWRRRRTSIMVARQGHASILSNRLDHWTPPPVFSRERSMIPRQFLQYPGSCRDERG